MELLDQGVTRVRRPMYRPGKYIEIDRSGMMATLWADDKPKGMFGASLLYDCEDLEPYVEEGESV